MRPSGAGNEIVVVSSQTTLARHPNWPAGRYATAVEPTTGQVILPDFVFASGEVLPELRLGYTTLGEPRRDADGLLRNALLLLHGTSGSGQQFLGPGFAGALFGPGQLLDARTHYLILPDAIGHGRSSRPSDGHRARFPRYTYDDMVVAQHRLLTEELGVDRLRLVMGTSMGGMHTWLWGIRYPAFMDGLVPLACAPTQIAGRNRMMRRMILDSIREDPDWRGGDYAAQPRGLRAALQILFMMTSSPLSQHRDAPTRDEADRYVTAWLRDRLAITDANDFLFQMDASHDYDPSSLLEGIQAPVLAINSADDLVNPPELGLMERLMPRVRRGRYVLVPASEATRGHGTHSLPALWRGHLAEFLEHLPRRGDRTGTAADSTAEGQPGAPS
jgi:homoserine O-acetyltransferase